MDYELLGLIIGIIIAIPFGLIPAYILKNKGDTKGFYVWWFLGWAFFSIIFLFNNLLCIR